MGPSSSNSPLSVEGKASMVDTSQAILKAPAPEDRGLMNSRSIVHACAKVCSSARVLGVHALATLNFIVALGALNLPFQQGSQEGDAAGRLLTRASRASKRAGSSASRRSEETGQGAPVTQCARRRPARADQVMPREPRPVIR